MSESTYNILSLDGGGLRGLITSTLLERIAERYPALLDNLDLVVGTSTGGILALALAKGLPPSAIPGEKHSARGREVLPTGYDGGQQPLARYCS